MTLTERADRVAAEAFSLLRLRYERRVMNNVDRGTFFECMVAALLGAEWGLTWILGDDWLPWDIEHAPSQAKIEIKQSAARQSWHPPNMPNARPPRFDIAPRQQYSPKEGRWIDKRMRAADLYIFGWHPEAREELADHRDPVQWEFIVVPTEKLPVGQKTIGLTSLRHLGESARWDSLASTVERMLAARSPDSGNG